MRPIQWTLLFSYLIRNKLEFFWNLSRYSSTLLPGGSITPGAVMTVGHVLTLLLLVTEY